MTRYDLIVRMVGAAGLGGLLAFSLTVWNIRDVDRELVAYKQAYEHASLPNCRYVGPRVVCRVCVARPDGSQQCEAVNVDAGKFADDRSVSYRHRASRVPLNNYIRK